MWLLWACADPLDDLTPYITEGRVLAVQVSPPEATPDTPVSFTALYVDADGPRTDAPVDWAFCLARKPLAEPGAVATDCLSPDSADLVSFGDAQTAEGTLPADGCSLFGPNPPPSADGEPAGRPADPDITGGYYQPVLAFDPAATLVSPRLRCGLPNVNQEISVAWNATYHDNANPTPTLQVDGVAADTVDVQAGAAVSLSVSWPACPEVGTCGDGQCSADEELTTCPEDCTTPVGCGGAETYVRYDPDTRTLGTRREALSAAWYTTAGTFAEARGGRSGDEPDTQVDNTWTAPDTAGEVWVGVVLRDERGGVAFTGTTVQILP